MIGRRLRGCFEIVIAKEEVLCFAQAGTRAVWKARQGDEQHLSTDYCARVTDEIRDTDEIDRQTLRASDATNTMALRFNESTPVDEVIDLLKTHQSTFMVSATLQLVKSPASRPLPTTMLQRSFTSLTILSRLSASYSAAG